MRTVSRGLAALRLREQEYTEGVRCAAAPRDHRTPRTEDLPRPRGTSSCRLTLHYIDVDTTLSGPLAPSRMRCLVRSIEGEVFRRVQSCRRFPWMRNFPPWSSEASVTHSICRSLPSGSRNPDHAFPSSLKCAAPPRGLRRARAGLREPRAPGRKATQCKAMRGEGDTTPAARELGCGRGLPRSDFSTEFGPFPSRRCPAWIAGATTSPSPT